MPHHSFRSLICLSLTWFILLSFSALANDDVIQVKPITNLQPDHISVQKRSALKASVQEAKLFPTPSGIGNETAGFFGQSVSIDGDRALVGAPGVLGHGVVYVYDYMAGTWEKTQVLIPNDGAEDDRFGESVSLDGDRALVGAFLDDDSGSASGSAYVFDLNGGQWSQTVKLTAIDAVSNDHFGRSISLSGDRALIGASLDDDNGPSSGSAYVFELNAGQWSQAAKLTVGDGVSVDFFAYSVSLLGDRALIGAYGDDDNGSGSGSAYVFDYNAGLWSETTKINAIDGASGDNFGYSVSLSTDKALVGAYADDDNGNRSGSAYVFDFDSNVWSQTAKLIADDGDESDFFGRSVSLSGNRALIGAEWDDKNGTSSGSAYVFDLFEGAWSQTIKLTADDGMTGALFGQAVSLSGDRLFAGAYGNHSLVAQSGAAYVFDLNAGFWTQTTKLTPGEGAAHDEFGYAVSLSGDRALVGAYHDDDNGSSSGAAYVFDYLAGDWSLTAKLTATDGVANDVFGHAVSLAGDRALISAWGVDDNGNNSGAVYVFDLNAGVWSQTTKLIADDPTVAAFFGYSVSLDGDRALIGAYLDDAAGIADSGAAYIFDFNGSLWSQTEKLTAADAADNDRFGVAVSLSGDKALIGAYLDDNDNGSNAGSAYVFDLDMSSWTQSEKLTAADGSVSDFFGRSVSLSGDRALVGSYLDDDNGVNSGAAYVFDSNAGLWSETSKLIAVDGAALDEFGRSVSLSGDRALIGAYLNDENGDDSGAAYLFNLTEGLWSQTNKLTAKDGAANDGFGFAVSLSGDRALVGAYLDDDNGTDSGSAYVLDADPKYSISVDVSGLAAGNVVEFLNNGGDNLSVSTNELATFSNELGNGISYDVTVNPPQPTSPNQNCVVANSMGVINNADVILDVVCTTIAYDIVVTVSGLDVNNTIELTTNGQSLDFSVNTTMNFPTPIEDGAAYAVLLTAQPTIPNQTCTVSGGNGGNDDGVGTVNGSDVSITVNCITNQYDININLTGLAATNTVGFANGIDTLNMTSDGLLTISALDDGSTFDVSITAQPDTPNQTCEFDTANSGELLGSHTTIEVSCATNSYFIGGNVTGLLANNYLVLQYNDTDAKVITANGVYLFNKSLLDEQLYSVMVDLQPDSPIQPCTVFNNIGVLAGEDVVDVDVVCMFGDDLIYRHGFDGILANE